MLKVYNLLKMIWANKQIIEVLKIKQAFYHNEYVKKTADEFRLREELSKARKEKNKEKEAEADEKITNIKGYEREAEKMGNEVAKVETFYEFIKKQLWM